MHQEAALRCLMHNLDPDSPSDVGSIVYGGALRPRARSAIGHRRQLRVLENYGTLWSVWQTVAVFRTH